MELLKEGRCQRPAATTSTFRKHFAELRLLKSHLRWILVHIRPFPQPRLFYDVVATGPSLLLTVRDKPRRFVRGPNCGVAIGVRQARARALGGPRIAGAAEMETTCGQ